MKYGPHILLAFAFVISSFSFSEVYGTGPLSFSQDRMVIDHSVIIFCNGCSDEGSSMDVTLSGNHDSLTVILSQNIATGDYASDFVKFCDSNCGDNDFTTAIGDQVTVSSPNYTPAHAEVFGSETLGSEYQVGAKVIAPNDDDICVDYGGDTDGDKICNGWENNDGYPPECDGKGLCVRTSASALPYFLECDENSTDWWNSCPDPNKADLFYEIDFMLGHKPSNATITAIADAFANGNFVSINSVGKINFHAQLDEELPHVDSLPWKGSINTPGFNQLKWWWFGTASERTYTAPSEDLASAWLNNGTPFESERSMKGQVFHYTIFSHTISSALTEANTSGIAERPGNDAIISLGSFDGMVGNEDQQQGTLLHEIGHNINLQHGGGDGINCKPNYLSVMSYSYQFPDYISDRALDFSRKNLGKLIENDLNENVGVLASNPPGLKTAYGPVSDYIETETTGNPIDWNRDGINTENPAIPPIEPDINNFGITDCMDNYPETLNPFRDWHKNNLIFTALGLSSGGVSDSGAGFNPDSIADDGMIENVVLNEMTSGDVIEMRIQRIDSIILAIDKIPDNDFIGRAVDTKESLRNDLAEIKTLIRQNIGGNNTMSMAYEKLDNLYLKLDGIGDDDVIKSQSSFSNPTRTLVADVVSSQSHSLGGAKDFLNLDREQNKREPRMPSPNPTHIFDSPYQQLRDGVPVAEIACNEGLERVFKKGNPDKPLCVSSKLAERIPNYFME